MARTTEDKLSLFNQAFRGRRDAYGTYDPRTGRARVVKAPVTNEVILNHLTGRQPFGLFLLSEDRIHAIVTDFDTEDLWPPKEFALAADHYEIPAYIERSKSKGYHVWVFFDDRGASAMKARLVVHRILAEIEKPKTEVFPKQDALSTNTTFGNFINAPLFGGLVPQGRTVFVDPHDPTKPYPNQWEVLERIKRVPETLLDDVIEINELRLPIRCGTPTVASNYIGVQQSHGLPPCARQMLDEGVAENQRIACFRLAVNLKRVGLPFDSTIAVLADWSQRNRPTNGKRVITESEITTQAASAYDKEYRAYGCEDPAVTPYCDLACQVRSGSHGTSLPPENARRASGSAKPSQSSM